MARISFMNTPMCDGDCIDCPHYDDEIMLCDYDDDYAKFRKEYDESDEI